MITVTVSADRDNRECSLLVKGHAGYAEEGKDIVCASASILTYTLAQIVLLADEDGELAETPTVDLESGDATISFRSKNDEIFANMSHTIFTISVGYRLLAQEHPQYVKLFIDGEDFSP